MLVHPGDLVFGDVDGVVIIPQDIAAEVIAAALEKISGENNTRADLEACTPLAELSGEYGICERRWTPTGG